MSLNLSISMTDTGRFVAQGDPASLATLKANSWLWLPGRTTASTGNIKRVTPYAEYCIGSAAEQVAEYIEKRRAATAQSVLAVSDMEIPAPPGMEYRGYQRAGIAYMSDRYASLNADVPRLGKEQPLTAKILTPSGWKTMGDMVVGQDVIAADGTVTQVTGVYPQGTRPAYIVRFQDGSTTQCGLDHLWAVRNMTARDRGQDFKVSSLRDILDGKIRRKNGKAWIEIPTISPAQHPERAFVISPYIMGYLLGNGSLKGDTPAFSFHSDDISILENIRRELPKDHRITSLRNTSTNGMQCNISCDLYKKNHVLDSIRAYGLDTGSASKYIPGDYLFASPEQRVRLLQGLLDSDGSCQNARTVFHSTNKRLAEDVVALVRSLGGFAKLHEYSRPDKPTYDCDYQVRINVDFCPFTLKRKSEQWRPSSNFSGCRFIENVEYVGDVEQQCISIAHPSHLYVTDDYIVTHNTIQTIGVTNLLKQDTKPLRGLVMGPANAKPGWVREVKKWSVHNPTVGYFEGDNNPETDVCVINWEIMPRHLDYLTSVDWDWVAVDEAHKLGNAKSGRTKIAFGKKVKGHKGVITAKQKFMTLTGTPVFTRPEQLFPLLNKLDPEGLGANWKTFVYKYCDAKRTRFGFDTSGASNIEELQYEMRTRFMVRREKSDVLDELPPMRKTVLLPATGLSRLLKNERSAFQNNLDRLRELMSNGAPDTALAGATLEDDGSVKGKGADARRELAMRKVPMVKTFVDELLETGVKVIVFYHHRDPLAKFYDEYPPEKIARVWGGMTTATREAERLRFQNSDECRIIVGNLQSMSEAIELSAADAIVFAEFARAVPSEYDQAEERAWLFDKELPIEVYRLVIEDSIEADLVEILDQRQEVIERLSSKRFLT